MAEVITGYEDISVGERGPGPPHRYIFSPESPVDQIFSPRLVFPEVTLQLFRAYNVPPDRRIFLDSVSVELAGHQPSGDAAGTSTWPG